MKKLIALILTSFVLSFNNLKCEENFFSIKSISNFHMNPTAESPVIYPIDIGKEMVLLKKEGEWLNLLDKQTGLVGWSPNENFSSEKPNEIPQGKNYEKSFEIFKGKVLEMSNSIKEAISIETFLDVKHLGGAAAVVIA